MAAFSIRDIPDAVLAAIDAHAQASGQSREAWARQVLTAAASGPVIRQEYAIRAWSERQPGQPFAHILIRRLKIGEVDAMMESLSEAQAHAYRLAVDLIKANGPGDRERAIGLLSQVFDEVVEVPAWVAKKLNP